MKRPTKIDYYLDIAEAITNRSTCLRRHYGAVIVKNDEIISTGYNGAARGVANCSDTGVCERERLNIPKGERYELCKAVHAEQNAIISASRKDMLDSTLYITGIEVKKDAENKYADPKPCLICSRMIKNAGIKEVIGRTVDGNYIHWNVKDL